MQRTLLGPESKTYMQTYFEHFTLLVEPPLETDNMVPKNEVFSVPQFGQGPWNYSFTC